MRVTDAQIPSDDGESALHTFIWIGLRHLPHNLTSSRFKAYLEAYDQRLVDQDGREVGGDIKSDQLALAFRNLVFTLQPLNELKKKLCSAFSARYEDRPQGAAKRRVHDESLLDLNDRNWLVDALQETADKLRSDLNDRRRQAVETAKELRIVDERLNKRARGEVEADWVNHILRLGFASQSGTQLTRTRWYDGYTMASSNYGPLPVDDDGQPKTKKLRTK